MESLKPVWARVMVSPAAQVPTSVIVIAPPAEMAFVPLVLELMDEIVLPAVVTPFKPALSVIPAAAACAQSTAAGRSRSTSSTG